MRLSLTQCVVARPDSAFDYVRVPVGHRRSSPRRAPHRPEVGSEELNQLFDPKPAQIRDFKRAEDTVQ